MFGDIVSIPPIDRDAKKTSTMMMQANSLIKQNPAAESTEPELRFYGFGFREFHPQNRRSVGREFRFRAYLRYLYGAMRTKGKLRGLPNCQRNPKP